MKRLGIFLIVVLTFISIPCQGKNRFPVWTENDDTRISNLEQFYHWLDDWGASSFSAITDSASKYLVKDTLSVSVVAAHYQSWQQIYLDAGHTLQLQQYDANNVVTYTRFDGVNTQLSRGWGSGTGLIGTIDTDNDSILRPVRKAIVGTHSAGYLYSAFARGSRFRTLPNNTPSGHVDSFQVSLRLLNRSGVQTTTVATISAGPEGGVVQSSKDLRIQDFPDTTAYHTFAIPVTQVGDKFYPFQFNVYWSGARTMYLDSMKVFDDKGKMFNLLVKDSLSQVAARVKAYYTAHPAEDSAVKFISIMDEITGPEFQQYEKTKRILDSANFTVRKDEAVVLGRYVGTDSTDLPASSYFDAFTYYSHQNYFNFDDYGNACYVRSSSSGSWDSTNFQYWVESQFIPHLVIARKRAAAQSPPVSFWVTVPTYAAYDCSDCNGSDLCASCKLTMRLYTPNEIRMIVNLSLLYGAKGIYYWEYMGRGGTAHTISGKASMPPVKPEHQTEIWDPVQNAYKVAPGDYGYSAGSCPTCTTLNNVQRPYIFKGLFSIVNGAAVRDTLWYFTREINHYLDSMAYFFLHATPMSAGRENRYIGSLNGSFIDSIKSSASYATPYIHAGFFDKDGEKYAFILNRRVDSNFCGSLDTQTVKVFMHGTGGYQVWDVYAKTADTIWSSGGLLRWDRKLSPGSAILIKMTHLPPRTIYVATTGSDVAGNGSDALPYKTIGKGIAMAVDGDRVDVMPGTYSGDGNRNLNFNGKAITVTKDERPGYHERPVIDCGGSPNRAFTFDHNETSSSELSHFIIRNGDVRDRVVDFVADKNGGGIKLQSSPVIYDCVIENCKALVGGGIHVWYNGSAPITPQIDSCLFQYDSSTVDATDGGAIAFAHNASATVRRSTFSHNVAGRDGGAIFVGADAGSPGVSLFFCVFSGNRAGTAGRGYGGAIRAEGRTLISSCTFVDNIALRGGALYAIGSSAAITLDESIVAFHASPGVLDSTNGMLSTTCSDFWQNTGGSIVGRGDSTSVDANTIFQDPLFCNWTGGNYHISSYSPCDEDSSRCHMVIGRYDSACTRCCNTAGDFNNDGVVDISDVFGLNDFLGSGSPVPPCPEEADADGSGGIPDISDLFAVLDYLSSGIPLFCPPQNH